MTRKRAIWAAVAVVAIGLWLLGPDWLGYLVLPALAVAVIWGVVQSERERRRRVR